MNRPPCRSERCKIERLHPEHDDEDHDALQGFGDPVKTLRLTDPSHDDDDWTRDPVTVVPTITPTPKWLTRAAVRRPRVPWRSITCICGFVFRMRVTDSTKSCSRACAAEVMRKRP